MNIGDVSRSAAVLLRLTLLKPADFDHPTAIEFLFEGNPPLILKVNEDDDSFEWIEARLEGWNDFPAHNKFEDFINRSIITSWEMTNHQGYFDSFQIELWDNELKRARILQFQAAASGISAYECSMIE